MTQAGEPALHADGSSDADVLSAALGAMCGAAHTHLKGAVRAICAGDEQLLLAEERDQSRSAAVAVRQARGAARAIARELLRQAEAAYPWPVLKGAAGAPSWPAGFIGSLAHDPQFAAAVAGPRRTGLCSVGIDIEPTAPLPGELVDLVATPGEAVAIRSGALDGKLLFCIKEAAYKAFFPLHGVVLDFGDVTYSAKERIARSRFGHEAEIFTHLGDRTMALAVVR